MDCDNTTDDESVVVATISTRGRRHGEAACSHHHGVAAREATKSRCPRRGGQRAGSARWLPQLPACVLGRQTCVHRRRGSPWSLLGRVGGCLRCPLHRASSHVPSLAGGDDGDGKNTLGIQDVSTLPPPFSSLSCDVDMYVVGGKRRRKSRGRSRSRGGVSRLFSRVVESRFFVCRAGGTLGCREP